MRIVPDGDGGEISVPTTRTEKKERAQEVLMVGIADALGYWNEREARMYDEMTEAERQEFQEILWAQANRVAKLLGFERALSN